MAFETKVEMNVLPEDIIKRVIQSCAQFIESYLAARKGDLCIEYGVQADQEVTAMNGLVIEAKKARKVD